VNEDELQLRERLARIEATVVAVQEESRALRTTLHDLIRSALADHSTAITRLAAAHDNRIGIWWALAWIAAGLVIVAGALAWLLEHQIQIVVKP
jgi:type VI protein secretion system component VasF